MLLLLLPGVLLAQFSDDFSDGNFSHNPTWVGDTMKFRVNANHQLQLHDSCAGEASLFAPVHLDWSQQVSLDCWVKLGFSPTANNSFCLGLYPSLTDREKALSIGVDSDKRIRVSSPSMLDTIVSDYRLASSTNALRLRLMCFPSDSQLSRVELWLDTSLGTEPDFYLAGVSDQWLLGMLFDDVAEAFFGLECRYTASRSTSFYFDDICVALGDPDSGTSVPVVRPGDLLISEVLFNPHPLGADYVELYNASDSALRLAGLRLVQVGSDGTLGRHHGLPDAVLPPQSWCVLTSDREYVLSHFAVLHPELLLSMASMPAYNDDSGVVLLEGEDSTLLDRLDYSSQMHSRLIRDPEGVALERRSYEAETQSTNNWFSAASTTSSGEGMGWGTPTGRNSQSKELLFVDSDWGVSPELFSPDGDGYDDLLDIVYHLLVEDLAANLTIFDAAGRPVRHLVRGGVLGTQGALVWDGTNDQGIRCPRGTYVILVEAYNTHGVRQVAKLPVSLVTN